MILGILGVSSFAMQKFIPQLYKSGFFSEIHIASRNYKKALKAKEKYDYLIVSESYNAILNNLNIDAVYLPLPPSEHYRYSKMALEKGKHVMVEKPITTKLEHTQDLIKLAQSKNLVIYENYMFLEHEQFKIIKDAINSGLLGRINRINSTFGYPRKKMPDIRYDGTLGGGALFDAGGYPLKLYMELFGYKDCQLLSAGLLIDINRNIDIFGTAKLVNSNGVFGDISFGIDMEYNCNIVIEGSKGRLSTDRVFTAPENYNVSIEVISSDNKQIIKVNKDNQALKTISVFVNKIFENKDIEEYFCRILVHSKYVSEILNNSKKFFGEYI